MLGFVAFSCFIGGSSYYLYSTSHKACCLLPPSQDPAGHHQAAFPNRRRLPLCPGGFSYPYFILRCLSLQTGSALPSQLMCDRHGAVVPSCPACSWVCAAGVGWAALPGGKHGIFLCSAFWGVHFGNTSMRCRLCA